MTMIISRGRRLQQRRRRRRIVVSAAICPDLVHDLLGTVFPVHFRVPVDDASVRRVLEISGQE